MVKLRSFAAGLLLGLLPLGCAGVGYRYYGLDAKSYEGTLLGPAPKYDLPFASCAPTASVKSPCVVILQDEFFKMKQELLQLRQDLQTCQGVSP